jgi:hypothetical protein
MKCFTHFRPSMNPKRLGSKRFCSIFVGGVLKAWRDVRKHAGLAWSYYSSKLEPIASTLN